MLCVKFSCNWHSASGKKGENDNSLQTAGQLDHDRQKIGNQKSSLMLLVQLGNSYFIFRVYGSADPIFQLMKINIMIFLTYVFYFSGKFMSNHKGFSIDL